MVVVVDDEDRENEGDLTLAAEKVTPEAIDFYGEVWARTGVPGDDERAAEIICGYGNYDRPNSGDLGRRFAEGDRRARGRESTGFRRYDRAHTIQSGDGFRANEARRIWRGRGTCFRCGRARAGCCRCGRGNGGVRGFGAHGGHSAGGDHLRNHERRRHDGAGAGPDRVLHGAQHEDAQTVAELIRYRMQHERYVHRVGEAMGGRPSTGSSG